MEMIKVTGLSKNYGAKQVLKGIDFQAREGEIIGIIGRNGVGKSTFLEILMLLKKYKQGNVELFGKDIQSLSITDEKTMKKKISAVLQPTQFYKKLSVKELLELFSKYYQCSENVQEVIANFELTEHLKTYFDNLSGGWKQRVSLAIAFLSRPKLVILDEPTTGLDPHMKEVLWNNIRGYSERHQTTIILSTHSMEEVELYCDRVMLIEDGQSVVFDTPQHILESGHENMNQFYLKNTKKGGK